MQKFTFDRDFLSEDPAHAAEAVQRRETRSAKVREAEAAGYEAGTRDAVAEAERRSAAALEDIAAALNQLMGTVTGELDLVRDETTRLAAHIARQFTSRLLADLPEDHIERTVEACLEIARREPSLTISIPEPLSETLGAKLTEHLERYGLGGQAHISSAPDLTGVSCRLDWLTGGAEISLDQTLQAIDAAVEDHIAATHLARSGAPGGSEGSEA